jgi:hypothetical protein
VREQVRLGVDPEVDLRTGHHEGVAGAERVDRQEADRAVVGPDEPSG